MNEDYYISLLLKQLDKTISREEADQLSEWLEQSEKHREDARLLKQIWNAPTTESTELSINPEIEFEKLDRRIQSEESNNPRSWNIWWLVAASVAITLTISLFLTDNLSFGSKNTMVITTKTQSKLLELSDGTKVTLNSNSTLTYPKKFSRQTRQVLLSGEAVFDVQHNENKPFFVETTQAIIKVLGTTFNIKENQQPNVTQSNGSPEF